MVVGAWLMYVGTPFYNYFFLYDSYNVHPKVEMSYFNWGLAPMIPLYAYIITTTLVWLYCLLLFSNGEIQI